MRARYTIYRIDLPDGRSYIGCTKHGVETRFTAHATANPGQWENPNGISAAIRRVGADNCSFSSIASAKTPQDAAFTETLLIAQHGTFFPGGYNLRANSSLTGKGASSKPQKPVRDWMIIKLLPKSPWPLLQVAA